MTAVDLFRYVGSPDGTYRIYPGTRMNALYDPRKRPWCVHILIIVEYRNANFRKYRNDNSETLYHRSRKCSTL